MSSETFAWEELPVEPEIVGYDRVPWGATEELIPIADETYWGHNGYDRLGRLVRWTNNYNQVIEEIVNGRAKYK